MPVYYNRDHVQGFEYQRCMSALVCTPLDTPPWITWSEEMIIDLADRAVHDAPQDRPAGFQTAYDPDKVINRLDAKGNPTGETLSMGDLFSWLQSFYVQEAMAQDGASQVAKPAMMGVMQAEPPVP